jgi:N-acetylglutamate synthase-like GNAT family acetyltransferase
MKGGLFNMEKLEIRNVSCDNIDHLISLCIPVERSNDPQFIEAAAAKREWAAKTLKQCGSIGKLAYLNSKAVGLIQYRLNSEEKIVEIGCILVPEKVNLRKGIGKSLFKAMMKDVKRPQTVFKNEAPKALVTRAFEVPGRYPQHQFYQRMGFRRVKEDDPLLLYYPLKKGYVYQPKGEEYIPQKDDKRKALIFYDPSCPFGINFANAAERLIREVAPDIPIRKINEFKESEEVRKRGKVPVCAVNGKAIQTFFMDKENFQKEVKHALSDSAIVSPVN